MKKLLLGLTIQLLISNTLYCCSFGCGYPSKFDKSLYFLEGKIVGFENHIQESTGKKFGSVRVKVLKTYHSPRKLKEINLIHWGLDELCSKTTIKVEFLKDLYSVGTKITFIAHKSSILNDDQINLDLPICYTNLLYKGTLRGLKTYDYKSRRKLRSEFVIARKQLQNANLSVSSREYWRRKEEIDKRAESFATNENNYLVPEGLQFYLDLLKVKNTVNPSKKYKLLESLLWSLYVQKVDFVKEQNISQSKKKELDKLFNSINSENPIY